MRAVPEKVLPDNVVPYRKCRDMTDLSALKKGHIHLFGNWQFPVLRGHKVDLFWNCQSFQEMEPEVVANYTSIVIEITDSVYLCHARNGASVEPAGTYTVREAIPVDAYPTRFLPGFEFADLSTAYVMLSEDHGFGGVCDAMLQRQGYREPEHLAVEWGEVLPSFHLFALRPSHRCYSPKREACTTVTDALTHSSMKDQHGESWF